jgi:formylglycine-generating enzyme required for sulfatase activity
LLIATTDTLIPHRLVTSLPTRLAFTMCIGNVWDWTEDCWNGNYQGAPTDGSAWTSGDRSKRVVRGGCWLNVPRSLRSADRSESTAVNRSSRQGFRVARALAP